MAFNSFPAVIGLQFEQEIPLGKRRVPSYDDDKNDYVPPLETPRVNLDVNNLCSCENCCVMPRETECLCCHDVDAIKYFKLQDKKCITDHENFCPFVLLKDTLWTALVALHDRESCGMANRDDVHDSTILDKPDVVKNLGVWRLKCTVFANHIFTMFN
ncbi:uncharacterized protein LOC130645492 [Hydractinia symbiolongicarpus]|uniref:uncharacterized protein LOC130645492 n=1 Tax=Hydractinia symbiolongicarpus TaxID=13093 RepID=UPI00254E89F2|nr:uncharacterized protein LOC130645492 [Hydractinia symbiolongicarpus]